jgi:hypothetical protein
MLHPPSPPSNVAVRAVWDAAWLLLTSGVVALAYAALTPLMVLIAAVGCLLLYTAGLTRVRLMGRTYALLARASLLVARLMREAILAMLHQFVLPAVREGIERTRFVGTAARDTTSLWSVVSSGPGGTAPEYTGRAEARGGRLFDHLRYCMRRREDLWLMPLYPYLVLLHLYREPAQGRPGVVPTNTYTLF